MWLSLFFGRNCIFKTNKKDRIAVNWLNKGLWNMGAGLLQKAEHELPPFWQPQTEAFNSCGSTFQTQEQWWWLSTVPIALLWELTVFWNPQNSASSGSGQIMIFPPGLQEHRHLLLHTPRHPTPSQGTVSLRPLISFPYIFPGAKPQAHVCPRFSLWISLIRNLIWKPLHISFDTLC